MLIYRLNDTVPPGQTVWRWYTANLESDGPGAYSTTAYFSAYNATCGISAPPYTGGWNGYNTTTSLLVSRPTITGVAAFWRLGPGILSDGGYYAQSALTANPNGAPGVPTWTVSTVSGGGNISLDCSVCVANEATATAPSKMCEADITVYASYAGFQSAPFMVMINEPKTMTLQGVVDGRSKVGVGYSSVTTWALTDLCGNQANGLDVNEQFGTWTDDYFNAHGVHNTWGFPTATAGKALTGVYKYLDEEAAWNQTTPPSTAPQSPLSSVKVMHNFPWTYFFGTQSFGKGVAVLSDTQQFYVDHGRHF